MGARTAGQQKPPRRRGAGSVDRNDQDLLSWRVEERLSPEFRLERLSGHQAVANFRERFNSSRDGLGADVDTAAEAIFLRPLHGCDRFRLPVLKSRVFTVRSRGKSGFGLAERRECQVESGYE